MKPLFLFLLSALAVSDTSVTHSTINDNVDITSSLFISRVSNEALSEFEKKAREAAVKVVARNGHGSGSYVKFRGFHLIFTAAHVVDSGSKQFVVMGDGEKVIGHLVYADKKLDVAVLLIPEMKTRQAVKYRPLKDPADVGTQIIYAGFPASHSLLSIRGMVAGHEFDRYGNKVLLLHSYAWFGCSGSGVYDEHGNFVGVLWGVDAPRKGLIPQIVEDIVWVTPSSSISEDKIIAGICKSLLTESRSCAAY